MAFLKGDAALSESMMNVITLVLSFVLIILAVQGIFVSSSDDAYSAAFEPLAQDIATMIDRTAALAGSQMVPFEITEGLNVNISIDHHVVRVIYDGGVEEHSFSGNLHSGPYFFENPQQLCLVKNRDDRSITIVPKGCSCNRGDGFCDPECLLSYVCDTDCLNEDNDYVCSKYCVEEGDGICDPDCYQNDKDFVCDSDCVIYGDMDGICDPDCDDVINGICDMDCVDIYNGSYSGDGLCDPDCFPTDNDVNGFEDDFDGYCYTGCTETKGEVVVTEKENPDYSCDPDSDCSGSWGSPNPNWRCSGARNVICCGESVLGDSMAVCSDGLNGWTATNYCYQPELSSGADCAQHFDVELSEEEAEAYLAEQKDLEVCCCDSKGVCRLTNYYQCGIGLGQSYPVDHEYCEGVGGKVVVNKLVEDGICDLDCNETNGICDPDCNLDVDCEDRCADVGQSCEYLSCCQSDGPVVCCPGTQICADASLSSEPACCGNGVCETNPFVPELAASIPRVLEQPDGVDFFPYFLANESAVHWENYYTCPEDCQASNTPDERKGGRDNAIFIPDLVCDNSQDGICDLADCQPRIGYDYADMDTNHDYGRYAYCDPDCSMHPVCPYSISRDQTLGDDICLPVMDHKCDLDCSTSYEVCDPDCCDFNSDSECSSSPACYCPTRVNMSTNFDKSPAFYGTNPEEYQNDKVYWNDGVVEVCSDAVIDYLDRRGWDIKQVEVSITSDPPLGFGFDGSRYSTIRNADGLCTPTQEGSFVQAASKTIEANENYSLEDEYCCAYACGDCADATYTGELCDGVGFCGDHAVAVLSILRTLGIPAYDVYAGFSSSVNPQFRHAYVIYYCDPELPEYQLFSACDGHMNEWLRVDATHHTIELFEGTQWCEHYCIAYNDYGAFAQIDAREYGFGGAYNSTEGYAFPVSGMGGWADEGDYNDDRGLNCETDPSCVLNRDSPDGLCQAIGLEECRT